MNERCRQRQEQGACSKTRRVYLSRHRSLRQQTLTLTFLLPFSRFSTIISLGSDFTAEERNRLVTIDNESGH